MKTKIDHNKAFSSLAPGEPEESKVPNPDERNDGDQEVRQEEYQEPEEEDLISNDEVEELEQSLLKDGYPINEVMRIIQNYIEDLKNIHKNMHDTGQLKDFLEQEGQQDQESKGSNQQDDTNKDPDQDLSQEVQGKDSVQSQEQSQEQSQRQPQEQSQGQTQGGPNPELLAHYMKVHEQQQKHIHQMMSQFAGGSGKSITPT